MPLLDLRQTLLLHVMQFDAETIAFLLHHIRQAHIFGICILDGEALGILPSGHG